MSWKIVAISNGILVFIATAITIFCWGGTDAAEERANALERQVYNQQLQITNYQETTNQCIYNMINKK